MSAGGRVIPGRGETVGRPAPSRPAASRDGRERPGRRKTLGRDLADRPVVSGSAGPSCQAAPESGMTRRTALKVLAASTALGGAGGVACANPEAEPSAHETLSGFEPLPPRNPLAAGTPTDPDLLAPSVPWEFVLTAEERRLASVLADVILPADDRSPAASAVGVVDYVDEFVSAPGHDEQLATVRGGLVWLNRTAQERFGAGFAAISEGQRREICDEICFEPATPPSVKAHARFFDLFRDLVSTGFWTTDEGMRDLGYVGNVPLPSFDGPPPEVLERLGLLGEDLE